MSDLEKAKQKYLFYKKNKSLGVNVCNNYIKELEKLEEQNKEMLNYIKMIFEDFLQNRCDDCKLPNKCYCTLNLCYSIYKKITGKSIEEVLKNE